MSWFTDRGQTRIIIITITTRHRRRNMRAALCHHYDVIRSPDVIGHVTFRPLGHFSKGGPNEKNNPLSPLVSEIYYSASEMPTFIASCIHIAIHASMSTDNRECLKLAARIPTFIWRTTSAENLRRRVEKGRMVQTAQLRHPDFWKPLIFPTMQTYDFIGEGNSLPLCTKSQLNWS